MGEMTSEGYVADGKPTGDSMTVKQVIEYICLYEEAIKKAAPTAWHRITLLFDKLREFEHELENLCEVMDELVYPEPTGGPKGSHWFCFECGQGGPGKEKQCECDKKPTISASEMVQRLKYRQRVHVDGKRAVLLTVSKKNDVYTFLNEDEAEVAVGVEELPERVDLTDWMEKKNE